MVKKKIALINLFRGHTEVFGYLVEIFKKNNYDITYVYKDNLTFDFYGYINYFETIFGIIEKKEISEFENIYKQFDIIVFITMTVDIPGYIQNHKNVYGIIHNSARKSPYINNYIALYPKQMENFEKKIKNKLFFYTYPFYNTPLLKNKEFKYILYIGNQFDNDEDIMNFKDNIIYELIFFNCRNKTIDSKDMFSLVQYLEKTIFILGKKTYYYDDSYSGSITISYSFNIPIILQQKKLNEYEIDGIGFENNYSELIDYVNNVDLNEYNNLQNKMNDFKQKEILKNENFFLNI